MLGKSFLTVDSVAIPNPVDFDVSFDEIENIRTSESGKDLVTVVRLDKRTFSGKWQLSSYWKDVLESFALKPEVDVIYGGQTYGCRARGYSAKLVENSAYANATDGLWEVNLDFIEQ